jgi:hypothetical protein
MMDNVILRLSYWLIKKSARSAQHMARPGVTYTEIAQAAHHLLGQGKNPTIEQIRLFLGTGSSTTIAHHLKQWKEGQNSSSLIAAKEQLPQELIAIVKGLWERVMDQSHKQVGVIQADANRTIRELEEEVQKYKTNNQRWQQLFNQWQQEKAQLSNDTLTLKQAIESLHKEQSLMQAKNEALQQQLQDKQERIDELHRLHSQAQMNLEHYRESAREQRLIEQQQFEQQKQELQAKVKILKEQLALIREKATSTENQYQALQQSYTMLEENYKQVNLRLEKREEQMIEIEKAKNEYFQASLHWQKQYQDMHTALEKQSSQLINAYAETKAISQQLLDTKKALQEAMDQSKLLAHEKWVLAQEKAQLEGQLKQMQKMIKEG